MQVLKVSFLWKRNNKNTNTIPLEKEQQKMKCCSFRKGIAENSNVVPLEKEYQKLCSFGKGTVKNQMSFLWKRNKKMKIKKERLKQKVLFF